MNYPNMEMVSNVAIPYATKVGDSNVQQQEIIQHNLSNTTQTTLQDEKETRNPTPVNQTNQFTQMNYQEEPITLFMLFLCDI